MRTSKIRTELKRIAQAHGGVLLPETVVRSARSESSPLHKSFEWDNSVAAQKYRIWQARQLISVVVEYDESVRGNIPVFVSLTHDRKKGGYRVITEVLSDAELRRQMISDALAELEVFQHKYKRLKLLAEVFASIRRVKRKAA